MKPVKPEQIDALLPFLDKFDAVGFSAGTWKTEPGQIPWFNFDEVATPRAVVLFTTPASLRSCDHPDKRPQTPTTTHHNHR